MHRLRNTKIIATLGPETNTIEMIESLFLKGVDVFRINFSHGKKVEHEACIAIIREVEQKYQRPIGILLDLQGPKLRIGMFEEGKILLKEGDSFCLDLINSPGNHNRVYLPHPEIFAVLTQGQTLLLDDGKIRLKVIENGTDFAVTEVIVGGTLSNKKGVNVPECRLPIDALTQKDREDLEFGLSLSIDWVALSFVQTPKDVMQIKAIVQNQAKIISKLEKPQAIDSLEEIVELSDAILVARGDLGVEMQPEDVPVIQKKIIECCHRHGKPVGVATQMLESMISNPTPTRAEASDVATAVYQGADAVMLSAETAVGKYPLQSVEMMDRIIKRVEKDLFHSKKDFSMSLIKDNNVKKTICDALMETIQQLSYTLDIKTFVVYSFSGNTALKAAKSRPCGTILTLTSCQKTYRYLTLVWGVHPLVSHEIFSFTQMIQTANDSVLKENLSKEGDTIGIIAGTPFGQTGNTNVLHIAKVEQSTG
ncbi:MAG: pyruvate kinase [Proteobacteria bacterium]|nr:pyruvate kinase [Pseudomonadota bacterium]